MTLKVVHISTYINGGAGSAAYRLHKALLESGVNSSFLYVNGEEGITGSNLHKLVKPKSSLTKRSLKKILQIVFGNNPILLNKNDVNHKSYKKIRFALKAGFASLPFSEYDLLNHPSVKEADIIHLHWIAGVLDYPSFFKNNTKPVVWTLHDMNPIKSLYHYSGDEKTNVHIATQLDHKMEDLKKRAIQNRQCFLTFVTPSRWLYNEVARSSIFEKVYGTTIANTLDTEEFFPLDVKGLRQEMKIPEENTIFLFVAEAINYSRKGFDLLIGALELLPAYPLTLIVIGNSAELYFPSLDVRTTGHIKESAKLKKYYSLADAFIIPSREDNLPNVMLESMACGTPVLSFNVGGMASVIIDHFNGLKAHETTVTGFVNILKEFIGTKENYNSDLIRKFAVDNFSYSVIAEKYVKIYYDAISNKS